MNLDDQIRDGKTERQKDEMTKREIEGMTKRQNYRKTESPRHNAWFVNMSDIIKVALKMN